MSHYDTLGVARDATLVQIRMAYRRAASKHHPDRLTGDKEKMQEVQLAYDVLSDPKRREIYDKTEEADTVALEKLAMERLREFFTEYLCVASVKDAKLPLVDIRAHCDKEIKEARGEMAHSQRMLQGIAVKLRRVIKVGSRSNLLEEVVQESTNRLNMNIQKQEFRVNVAMAILALLDEYEHTNTNGYEFFEIHK